MQDAFVTKIKGHVLITDDHGNVVLDKNNAIHPQNMSRVITRGLANEPNHGIYRMAFGNGGTEVDAAYTITYRRPNVGTWDSRLYHETFSKVVDESSPNLGLDPGSADSQTGVRPGGGAIANTPAQTSTTSIEPDTAIMSEVIVRCTIAAQEPRGQDATDYLPPASSTEGDFVFDEIGLYSFGRQPIDTVGYQLIDVNNKTSTADTGLLLNQQYSFNVSVDGNPSGIVTFVTPITGGTGPGGQILYGDLCQALNTADSAWQVTGFATLQGAKLSITDDSAGAFPSIEGAQTYGFLRLESSTVGPASTVDMAGPETNLLLAAFLPQATLLEPVSGAAGGDKNNITNPAEERERLLAHLIFSPIQKAANRTLYITYTITVAVVGVSGNG